MQFVKGLETLYAAGARVFVEVGPKSALQGFADDVLRRTAGRRVAVHEPPEGRRCVAFNQALCGLYAAGLGAAAPPRDARSGVTAPAAPRRRGGHDAVPLAAAPRHAPTPIASARSARLAPSSSRARLALAAGSAPARAPVVITGAALGLPGTERIFDDGNVGRLLDGEQLIDVIPARIRHAILDKHITRLVKSDDGGARFETIERERDVHQARRRAAARSTSAAEFGVAAERIAALDRMTQLAIGAGIDALRDAGIPLVMHYQTTSKGTQLPERLELPEALRDDTGVIFASAFPGLRRVRGRPGRYHADRARREQLALLEGLRARLDESADGARRRSRPSSTG